MKDIREYAICAVLRQGPTGKDLPIAYVLFDRNPVLHDRDGTSQYCIGS